MPPRAGFTLIDTLIAIMLLEVALLGLAGALSSGERLLARGRLATRAAAQSRDLLARIARRDTVCAATTGIRVFPGGTVAWAVDVSPSLRRVTALIDRPGAVAADTVATMVQCP